MNVEFEEMKEFIADERDSTVEIYFSPHHTLDDSSILTRDAI